MRIRVIIRKIVKAIRMATQPWQDRDKVKHEIQEARKLVPPLPWTVNQGWPGHRDVTRRDGESQEAWIIRRDNHRKEF